jgi:glycosyltransferase involved in cell wall biosynthesis
MILGRSTHRVCIVASYAPSVVSFRGDLIDCIVKKGHSVVVLSPDHNSQTVSELRMLGASADHYQLSRSGLNPLLEVHTFISLFSAFRRHRPTIVLTSFVKPNIWGILAAWFARIPVRVGMVEGMGYTFTPNSFGRLTLKQTCVGRLILLLYRLAFLVAHRVVVLNQDDMKFLQSSCGLQSHKAVLLRGIGISLSKWKMKPASLSPLTFTMVARLLREKGVFEFLNAAQMIKRYNPDTRFLLLGGVDESRGSIRLSDLEPWTKSNCVQVLGHVDVLPWLYRTSVFVLPSYREGLPRSTQEAMALGLPVVTTNVPGCRETVDEGVNGFLVPPRDVMSLYSAMQRFIDDPSLIERMGRASRCLAEARFDVQGANKVILEALGL